MDGLILAAGLSSRFDGFKLQETWQGQPMLLHTISAMKGVVNRIIVVTGHHHEVIEEMVKDEDMVECIHNPHYLDGMFSSVKCGLKAVGDACFLTPGDCALVAESTYQRLARQEGDLLIPSYHHQAGHPIVLSKRTIKEVLKSDALHLRQALANVEKTYVQVDDKNVLVDIDTRKDFSKYTREERA